MHCTFGGGGLRQGKGVSPFTVKLVITDFGDRRKSFIISEVRYIQTRLRTAHLTWNIYSPSSLAIGQFT